LESICSLQQNSLQRVFLEQEVNSIQNKNPLIRFFYWLFNIRDFAFNRHKLFILKALKKKIASKQQEEQMEVNAIDAECKDQEEPKDLVEEIQLIFAGLYDDQEVIALPNDLETCDNLDRRIYREVLQPFSNYYWRLMQK
jgi:hypothetical protein